MYNISQGFYLCPFQNIYPITNKKYIIKMGEESDFFGKCNFQGFVAPGRSEEKLVRIQREEEGKVRLGVY